MPALAKAIPDYVDYVSIFTDDDQSGRQNADELLKRLTTRGLHLADYEQIFRAQEVNKPMKDKAAHACHALCRARVVGEIKRRNGTPTADHLKLVLSIIDGPRFPLKDK